MSMAVVRPARLGSDEFPLGTDDLSYSVRRYFVDEFFVRRAGELAEGSRVLDIGGHKHRKRGRFDIGRLPLRVTYANINAASEPDIVCDACDIPCGSGTFDAVVLAEVVEHLPDPARAVREAARVLRPGGVLLATAPFLFRVHPDPIDVGRYAPDWWTATLSAAGFGEAQIEPQGMFFSVLAEMVRGWAMHLRDRAGFWPGAEGPAIDAVRWVREQASRLERRAGAEVDAYLASYTTGYGVKAVRA